MKKLLTVLLAAVMLFTAIPVMAFAESIEDTAVAVESGDKKTVTLENKGNYADYKIAATEKGDLDITLSAKMSKVRLAVYDSDGNVVAADHGEYKSGKYKGTLGDDIVLLAWNDTTEKLAGTVTYKIEKGTYYIRVIRGWGDWGDAKGTGKISMTAKFPSEEKEEAAKISVLGITMKKGDTMQLTADLTSKDGKVTWKSSKKTVATVSEDGVVTAVKKGTATITAKCGKSTMKLKITVK